jgi:hypothetical protein
LHECLCSDLGKLLKGGGADVVNLAPYL